MLLQIFLSIFLMFSAFACTNRYADYFPYHDDGTKKPHIAFLPVLDSSEFCLDDSLSHELTMSVCKEIMYSGDLYLMPEQRVAKMMTNCGSETDFFGKNLAFADQFEDADFIVITELIEHEILPRDQLKSVNKIPCGPGAYFAQMKVRIRVVDCRGKNPRIALQEILESHQPISTNVACNPIDNNGYREARQRLTDQLVCRLETVIWSCR